MSADLEMTRLWKVFCNQVSSNKRNIRRKYKEILESESEGQQSVGEFASGSFKSRDERPF